MTPEQQDESNWLAEGKGLAIMIENAMTDIMGRRVAWCLLVWPHDNKTLTATYVDNATVKEGLQAALDKFDTMRTEVKA